MKTLVMRANCHRLIYRNWVAANEQFPVGRISLKRVYFRTAATVAIYIQAPAENYFRCARRTDGRVGVEEEHAAAEVNK